MVNHRKATTAMDETRGTTPAQSVTFIVTLQEHYLGRVQEVTEGLEAAGLTIDKVLGTLGQVVGHGDDSGRARMAGVLGVESVVAERRFGIAPPDSGIQ